MFATTLNFGVVGLEQKPDESGLCLKNGDGLLNGKNAVTWGTNNQMEAVLFLAGSGKPGRTWGVNSVSLSR